MQRQIHRRAIRSEYSWMPDTREPCSIGSWFSIYHFYSNAHALCRLCFGKAVKTGFYNGASLESAFPFLHLIRRRVSKPSTLSCCEKAETYPIEELKLWFLCHSMSVGHSQCKPLTWFAYSQAAVPQGTESDCSLTAQSAGQPSAVPFIV